MRASFKLAQPFVGVFCAFLMLGHLTITPQLRADVPDRYVWQIERVEESDATYIINSFEGGSAEDPFGDIAWVKMDIPAQFFPLELWEIHSWHQNSSFYNHGLAAKFYLYRGSDGTAKYLFEHAVVLPDQACHRPHRPVTWATVRGLLLLSCTGRLVQSGDLWQDQQVGVNEDDTAYGATHALGCITIHQSYFDGDRWDLYGVDGLALLLFAEWQHYNDTSLSERQCQHQLMQWRQQVGFEDVAPEINHGFSD